MVNKVLIFVLVALSHFISSCSDPIDYVPVVVIEKQVLKFNPVYNNYKVMPLVPLTDTVRVDFLYKPDAYEVGDTLTIDRNLLTKK